MSPLLGVKAPILPTMLVTWLVLAWAFRRSAPAPRPWFQAVLAAASLGIALLPVGGLPISGWVGGFVPGLSVPALALLLDGILRQTGSFELLDARQRTGFHAFVVLAGVALYPSALGLGRFDAYALGWEFSSLTVLVGVLAIFCGWRSHPLGDALLVAVIAWRTGLLGSLNLWDALVDPLVFVAGFAGLARAFARRCAPISTPSKKGPWSRSSRC